MTELDALLAAHEKRLKLNLRVYRADGQIVTELLQEASEANRKFDELYNSVSAKLTPFMVKLP